MRMAGMRSFGLSFRARNRILAVCCRRRCAVPPRWQTGSSSAVPLWKVIVGSVPTRLRRAERPGVFHFTQSVVPGRAEGADPEPMNTDSRYVPHRVHGSRVPSLRSGPGMTVSRVQALAVEPLVETSDMFGVAVEQQRRAALAEPDELLGSLAPARMRHLGVDVGPEPVFGRLQGLPKTLRPLIGEAEAHD